MLLLAQLEIADVLLAEEAYSRRRLFLLLLLFLFLLFLLFFVLVPKFFSSIEVGLLPGHYLLLLVHILLRLVLIELLLDYLDVLPPFLVLLVLIVIALTLFALPIYLLCVFPVQLLHLLHPGSLFKSGAQCFPLVVIQQSLRYYILALAKQGD